MPNRIHLSPPHLGAEEFHFVKEAFASNWIAPHGPHLSAFEAEFAERVGASHAVAVDSGTAGLHLAMRCVGVRPGDEVFVSSFTFVASANPILYEGGRPVFIDSERDSWNMDPALLERALRERSERGRLPRAVVVVHLYGQSANMRPILASCRKYGVPVIEDAAEAVGARHEMGAPGTLGEIGVFSFNGNKIITTGGGGMLVARERRHADFARHLSTQARDPGAHYEHSVVGYNYRLSNVLAGIGRGQLRVLDERVAARQANFERYRTALGDLPGVTFMPEAPWGRSNRWLSCILIDPRVARVDRERVRLALEAENIESRPLWQPLHLQPLFAGCEVYGGAVSEALYADGLCLPSGSSLEPEHLRRVVATIRAVFPRA